MHQHLDALRNRMWGWIAHMQTAEHTFMVVVAVLIGILGGLGAVGFRYLIRLVQRIGFGDWQFSLEVARALPWYWSILVPACGGLLVGFIVYRYAREAKGHGVPEVMEAVALRNGVIRPQVVVAKALASAICIGSGGSVGREGPIVQIGSAIGSTVSQWLRLPSHMTRTFVGCGAAAGIAATFNTPIAGALFAVEVILGEFGIQQFSPIVISSVVATVISRHYLGDFPAFEVPAYAIVSAWELLFYVGLGVAAGIVSVLFIKAVYGAEDLFEKLPIPEYLTPAVGGAIIGVMALQFPHIYGVGYDTINLALHGEMVWHIALVLVLIKIIASSVTLGSGGSGGIFAPSLFLGAMLGCFVGNVAHTFFPNITSSPGAYALVGMGAIVAAATQAPITAIIIIFEMTGNYTIIVPVMLTCIISTLVATRLHPESMYTLKLVRRNINIRQGQEVNVLRALPVSTVMQTTVITIPDHTMLNDLLARIISTTSSVYYVLDQNEELVGVIDTATLRLALYDKETLSPLLIARDMASEVPAVLTTTDNLDTAQQLLTQHQLSELPVMEAVGSRKLAGLITHTRISEAYNAEIFKRESIQGVASRLSGVQAQGTRTVIPGYDIASVPAPKSFHGRTIKELEVRTRYGVHIVLIKRPAEDNRGQQIEVAPNPDSRIQPHDELIVMGNAAHIRQLRLQ